MLRGHAEEMEILCERGKQPKGIRGTCVTQRLSAGWVESKVEVGCRGLAARFLARAFSIEEEQKKKAIRSTTEAA
ncbi:hypothetical protein Baya_1157 [Bagarius yarrelli]|uniref:Uncharacterized protein n=1 Tax=Bagarius yarrelli TaxID=175774 RepID=A0A556TKB4_BAGYA|nr:hypothetical protein Baya_1157 [Bagarius yarrelli]